VHGSGTASSPDRKRRWLTLLGGQCIHCPPWGIPWGSIYMAVKGLDYIIQTAPNCPMNHAEYSVITVIHNLQLFPC
jgi:hypothetical protein